MIPADAKLTPWPAALPAWDAQSADLKKLEARPGHARAPCAGPLGDPEQDPCELHDLRSDFSQADDLSKANPERMRELEAIFWEEARTCQVLPLLGGIGVLWGIRDPADGAPQRMALRPGVENVAPPSDLDPSIGVVGA